ncbi:hypothetical protein CGZ90_05230 [Fictibacillus aquaticus]|uniref:N-acetyltransferase domain-containing protein n=2 Tax=Fictibacillus aquaticus TaxID=2021314 RepID=A0A235FFV2_9BACL|nr:hypothetical protein CGZ90_05230 [Fictibacillus aquaticus]
MIFLDPPVLENERIKLVPLQKEYAPELFAISTPDIWSYMFGEIKTEAEMIRNVSDKLALREQAKALPFTVILKETGEVAGTTSLYQIDFNQKSCELGATWYATKFQRTFVNSDCKYLLLNYCFEELKFIRVQIKTDERNVRSQKAIERLGAVKEGVLRNERILESGYIRNCVLYSITDGEWPSVKQGLCDREAKYQTT